MQLTPSADQPAFEPRVWLALEGVNPASVAQELSIESDHVPPPEVMRLIEADGRTYSSWTLDTHGRVLTNKLSDHVDWFVAQLSGKEDIFATIVAGASRAELMVYGARSEWEVDDDAAQAVRARLGVPLAFCVIVITSGTL